VAHFDAALDGQLLEPSETGAKLGIGLLERRAWIDAQFSSEVHHGEQEVSNLFARRCITVTVTVGKAHFLQLFADLLAGAIRIGPIKPDAGRAFLKAECHEEGRKTRWEPVHDA